MVAHNVEKRALGDLAASGLLGHYVHMVYIQADKTLPVLLLNVPHNVTKSLNM